MWQEVRIPKPAGAGFLTVFPAGSGFVIAGTVNKGPAAWSSTDGVTWVEETVPGDSRLPSDGVAWGDRVLLVGSGDFPCAHPVALNTWVREPDSGWSQAPFQDTFCAGGSATVETAGGLAVMVGAGSGDVAHAWTSADGLHWAEHPGAFPIGLPFRIITTTVGFLAFGVSEHGAWVERSTDGFRWSSPVRLPGGPGTQPLGAGIAGSGSLVVVLSDPSGSVATAQSVDGEQWTAQLAMGLNAFEVNRVETVPGGLVGIGSAQAGPFLRLSGDGVTWRNVPLPDLGDGGLVADIAVSFDRAVLITGRGKGFPDRAWVAPASLLAP